MQKYRGKGKKHLKPVPHFARMFWEPHVEQEPPSAFFLSKMHQPDNISPPSTGNKHGHMKRNSQLLRTSSILARKIALFHSYIIHLHTVTEDVRCVKKVGLVIVGGCIPRRDTGAQRRVRRSRDSLTPGRADPRQAGREHTHTGRDTERESCSERKGTVNFSGLFPLSIC